jgi:hypothetical protein
MVAPHGINSDFDSLSQDTLSLSFVALFLLVLDGDDQLALVEAASRAYAVRDVESSTLGALGKPGKLQTLPIRPAAVSSGCCVMFFWICHS